MTLILRWRQPAPALSLAWRGPDSRVRAAAAASPERPVAAVIGPPGNVVRHVHQQPVPSTVWTINHNLGFVPSSVSIRSTGGAEVDADVLHISANQLTITFLIPFAGSAYIF